MVLRSMISLEREYAKKDFIDVTKQGFGGIHEAETEAFFQECVYSSHCSTGICMKKYVVRGSDYFDVRGEFRS